VSATRLLVLGVVEMVGAAHGYQVRQILLSWRAEAWAHVVPASIYQAMRTLTKLGQLERLPAEGGGRGPERTLHRVTAAGRRALLELVRTGIADPGSGFDALNAAFGFLHLLDRDEVAALFDALVQALQGRVALVEQDQPWPKPPQVEGLMRLHAARVSAELEWAQAMAAEVRGGAYRFTRKA
jgi:DNA-binding PadR family transcriptional regulator